ncbi:MAG: hypothetical protein Q8N36_05270 [bacterium]|nr:hypothetical protein [bacterium]
MFWQEAVMVIPVAGMNKVARMDVRLCMEDVAGTINMADVMLQGGVLATLWIGHASEIRFSFEQ